MTLVVSEVSEAGILMVGDSAASIVSDSGQVERVECTSNKVVFNEKLNIGISCWGHASLDRIGKLIVDEWVMDFLHREETRFKSIKILAQRLATELNSYLRNQIEPDGSWEDVRAGYHIAGYDRIRPVLYHVHCGHDDNEPFHELVPYYDFPDLHKRSNSSGENLLNESNILQDKPWEMRITIDDSDHIHKYGSSCSPETEDPAYKSLFNYGFFHLRNGIVSEFVSIWNDRVADTQQERRKKGNYIDSNDLSERFAFYVKQLQKVCEIYADKMGEKATIALPITGICFNLAGCVTQIRNRRSGEGFDKNLLFKLRY